MIGFFLVPFFIITGIGLGCLTVLVALYVIDEITKILERPRIKRANNNEKESKKP